MPELEIDELYERCLNLELERYSLEDKIDAIIETLLHSSISIEEMYKIGEIVNE